MSQTDIEMHMLSLVYPAAREAIGVLKDGGIRVIHVDALARQSLRPPGIYEFNDASVLIRQSDLAAFRSVMEAAGYRYVIDNPNDLTTIAAPEAEITRALQRPIDPPFTMARVPAAGQKTAF